MRMEGISVYLCFVLCLVSLPCSVALVIRKPCEESTALSSNSTNGCNTDLEPSPCHPPDNMTSLVELRGMSMLGRSASFAVYGADIGIELELLIWDCNRQKRLEFLHIPKNAGTTIEDVGNAANVKWGRFRLGEDFVKMPDGNLCSTWHVPPAYLPSPNPYEDEDVEIFCVTRDPWDRVISEYMYRLEYPGWREGKSEHLFDGAECTPEGLNAFVTGTAEDAQAGQRFTHDCHMLPQWDYIEDDSGRVWCKHVLPIDQLTDTFNGIMIEHGLSVRLKPHEKSNSAASVCPSLKSHSTSELFSKPAQTALRKLWMEDFLHLGDSISGEGPKVVIKEADLTPFQSPFESLESFEASQK